jgi:putative SOS response-associated peptidase YedK
MCNDYEQHVRWAEYRRLMQALDLAIPSHQTELGLPQADDIRINDMGPVMRAAGEKVELVPMTFAFPPARPGGAPVFDFRSEGRHFANSNRCLMNSPARSTRRQSTGLP